MDWKMNDQTIDVLMASMMLPRPHRPCSESYVAAMKMRLCVARVETSSITPIPFRTMQSTRVKFICGNSM